MELTQWFETEVTDRESGFSARFLTIPNAALPQLAQPQTPPTRDRFGSFAEALDLKIESQVRSPTAIQPLIASVLAARDAQSVARLFRIFPTTPPVEITKRLANELSPKLLSEQLTELTSGERVSEELAVKLLNFAQALSFCKLVPFEQSPLDLHALTTLAAHAGIPGLGLAIGLAALEGAPLALLVLPAGIILVYGAVGLGEGLRERLRKLLAPKRERK